MLHERPGAVPHSFFTVCKLRKGALMIGSVAELWKRTNEAGVRLVRTEIDVAASLIERVRHTSHPRLRMECFRDAQAAIETASRIAQGVWFADGEERAVTERLQRLQKELELARGIGIGNQHIAVSDDREAGRL